MSTQISNHTMSLPLRRANDYLVNAKRFRYPEMLFDEFWREGELALMFGPAASGKSLLAVQLADALARGGGMYGFRMPAGRRRVLYVDLRHTDEQFRMRCSYRAPGGAHKFPRGMFRDRPPEGSDLIEWLRAFITEHSPQVVIIDDLAAVKNTDDGTRETLKLMRRLRSLRDELGVSILVLTECREPKGIVAETDLGRSRVLCTVADSVFAVGRYYKREDDHYLVQTRARSARIFWTRQNAPTATVFRTGSGLLSFDFDERFSPDMDADKRRLICEIVRLTEVEGHTFREAAAELGISKSWAAELYRRWTPAMEAAQQSAISDQQSEQEEWDETAEYEYEDEGPEEEENADDWQENGSPPYEGGVAPASGDGVVLYSGNHEACEDADAENHPVPIENIGPPLLRKEGSLVEGRPSYLIPRGKEGSLVGMPFLAALRRRSVYDLERDINGYGHEIWVAALALAGLSQGKNPAIAITTNRSSGTNSTAKESRSAANATPGA